MDQQWGDVSGWRILWKRNIEWGALSLGRRKEMTETVGKWHLHISLGLNTSSFLCLVWSNGSPGGGTGCQDRQQMKWQRHRTWLKNVRDSLQPGQDKVSFPTWLQTCVPTQGARETWGDTQMRDREATAEARGSWIQTSILVTCLKYVSAGREEKAECWGQNPRRHGIIHPPSTNTVLTTCWWIYSLTKEKNKQCNAWQSAGSSDRCTLGSVRKIRAGTNPSPERSGKALGNDRNQTRKVTERRSMSGFRGPAVAPCGQVPGGNAQKPQCDLDVFKQH